MSYLDALFSLNGKVALVTGSNRVSEIHWRADLLSLAQASFSTVATVRGPKRLRGI
jgi:hypothetical protein